MSGLQACRTLDAKIVSLKPHCFLQKEGGVLHVLQKHQFTYSFPFPFNMYGEIINCLFKNEAATLPSALSLFGFIPVVHIDLIIKCHHFLLCLQPSLAIDFPSLIHSYLCELANYHSLTAVFVSVLSPLHRVTLKDMFCIQYPDLSTISEFQLPTVTIILEVKLVSPTLLSWCFQW